MGRGTHLYKLAFVHDRDSRCQIHGLFLVMGDDDERNTEFMLYVHQLELSTLPELLIQRGQRFI